MTQWLTIIGIGEDGLAGLSEAARALIDAAELLIGGERHLAMVPPGAAARHAWESPLSRTVERIADWRGRRVVVLASGDPMCYGVGVTLARRFDPTEFTVLPQLGAFSLAAARLAWPLADCATVTVHGRPLERLLLHVAPGQRLLVLSEDGATPARIAALLRDTGWGPSRLTILEHLGGAQERLLTNDAAGWTEPVCADLNTVAIECRPGPGARPWSRAAGLPDDAFLHDGQLTKREIRAATIAALAPLPGQILWDVGAGSGSIAIEFLRAAPRSRAFAIEQDAARRDLIARNAAALGVPELTIVAGSAPAALADLPRPDAVFVGGGVTAPGMLEQIWTALAPGGRLVANAVTVEGEARLVEFQSRHGGDLVRIAVTRAAPVGERLGWRPLMPVTQLAVSKPDSGP
jgi:precorrin-6B C5,15-methyltransferase / cobalt-precorrin-6B C5,C15-methyltransferase